MDITFITMHDLSEDARCLYASESVQEVLGYLPHELLGKKLFDYFHPEEMHLAKSVHGRGVRLDKAAVLVYCRIKCRNGQYVGCECIFSVVYDVFVAATSIYQRSQKSRGRALTAPVIRRVFSSSPHDPRYNMLTHLSSKFRTTPPNEHEPRAALILNRFTRSLTVLYSSLALSTITGFSSDSIIGRSFYEFINEDCLQNAVEAFERAKENDSIAYLRFRWRNPMSAHVAMDGTAEGCRDKGKRKRQEEEDGEVLNIQDLDGGTHSGSLQRRPLKRSRNAEVADEMDEDPSSLERREQHRLGNGVPTMRDGERNLEVEAVVSCTSDGLVVVLRRARPLIPKPFHGTRGPLFASPWARNPLVPPAAPAALEPNAVKNSHSDFMESIRQVAVFAWSLHSLGGEAVTSRERQSSVDQVDLSDNRRSVRGSSCPPAVVCNGSLNVQSEQSQLHNQERVKSKIKERDAS